MIYHNDLIVKIFCLGMEINKYYLKSSLENGRIKLDQSTPNQCTVSITNVTEDDNGAWKITSLLCSRGRGKRYENAFLHVKGMPLDDKKFSLIYTILSYLMEPNTRKINFFLNS